MRCLLLVRLRLTSLVLSVVQTQRVCLQNQRIFLKESRLVQGQEDPSCPTFSEDCDEDRQTSANFFDLCTERFPDDIPRFLSAENLNSAGIPYGVQTRRGNCLSKTANVQ